MRPLFDHRALAALSVIQLAAKPNGSPEHAAISEAALHACD
jgi:hypothetical protein